jgi:hypothetical protein
MPNAILKQFRERLAVFSAAIPEEVGDIAGVRANRLRRITPSG